MPKFKTKIAPESHVGGKHSSKRECQQISMRTVVPLDETVLLSCQFNERKCRPMPTTRFQAI